MLDPLGCTCAQLLQLRTRLAAPLLSLAAVLIACANPHSDSPPGSSGISMTSTHKAYESGSVWQVAGTSVQGRPIQILTLGQGPRKVLYVGGIHGDEAEGSHTTAALPGEFLASGLAKTVTLTLVDDVNPDGRVWGTRGNANDVDINRNFPATNFDGTFRESGETPLSQPESRALFDVIERTRPELVVVMHSWDGRQFINFDGPARAIAERFSTTSGLPLAESSSFSPTPGSLGSYLGRDRRVPLITIELLRGSDPEKNWELIREALIQVIAGRG